MPRHLAALTLALLLPVVARAEILPTFSLRELAVRAPVVVVAAPDGALASGRFKVLQVLRGRGLRAGDAFTVAEFVEYQRKREYYLNPYTAVVPGKKTKGPHVTLALLFLYPPRDSKPGAWGLELSGVRFLTEDSRVLIPMQQENPGPYHLAVQPRADWAVMLRRLRTDLVAADRVLRARRLGLPATRNRALLEWVERHRNEFGGGLFVRAGESEPAGWGSVETEVFEWVLTGCRAEDCWAAVRLYAQLNSGSVPKLSEPSFGTSAGRRLLARVALDSGALEADRVRALTLLANASTLAPAAGDRHPEVKPLEAREQKDLLDKLSALLKSKSPALRAAAAQALLRIAAAPTGTPAKEASATVAALTDAYRAEPPGPTRDALAEAVCALAGPRAWQELTGNPPGLFVCLRDLERKGNEVHFWLNMNKGRYVVYEAPTLFLERLSKKGKVVEAKQLPLPVANLPRPWSEGWDGESYLLVQLPLAGMKPGTWRVSVRGSAGKQKDRVKWTAEPRTFVIAGPKPLPGARPPRRGFFEW